MTIMLTIDGCEIAVSTVRLGGREYHRVEADECEPLFYGIDMRPEEAAKAYLDGFPSPIHYVSREEQRADDADARRHER